MLCGLSASTFLFSIVSSNFNNTWHKPVVGAGGTVVLATLRPPDSTACPHHRLTPLTLRYNVPVLTCGSDGTALSAFMWEAQNLHCFPLDTLYSPEGMQCVLKKIMNCHEVPYSLITKKPRHIHNLSVHGLGADFIIF